MRDLTPPGVVLVKTVALSGTRWAIEKGCCRGNNAEALEKAMNVLGCAMKSIADFGSGQQK